MVMMQSQATVDERDKGNLEQFLTGEKTLAEAQNVDPKIIDFAAQQASLFFKQGKLDDAERIYRGLFAIHPKESYFPMALGLVYQQRKQYQDACDWYLIALEKTPDNCLARLYLGEVLIALDRLDEAKAHLEKGIALASDTQHPTVRRGTLIYEGLLKRLS